MGASSLASDTRGTGNDPTILFVDDERRVLSSMRATFRRGYNVLLANSGAEALQLFEEHAIDVVVSDQRMPAMTGVEMLAQVRERWPSTMRILLTGYADLQAIEASINEAEVFRYLMKPCPAADLRAAVGLAIEAAEAGRNSAKVIPFPNAPEAEVQPESMPAAPEPVLMPAQATDRRIDIVVLSADDELFATIRACAGETHCHRATAIADAAGLLASHPVGVLVTDSAVEQTALNALTTQLKRAVPELVTIVVAERSDAMHLIGLINDGQVFRFLLKPVPRGQSRLWIQSALRRFAELTAHADPQRHRAAPAQPDEAPGWFQAIGARIRRLRKRLGTPERRR